MPDSNDQPVPARAPALAGRTRHLAPVLALGLGLGLLLVACGQDAAGPDAQRAGEPVTPARDGTGTPEPERDPARPDGPYVAASELPATRELPVTVEGSTELRTASLFESPQAYAIYVLPQLVMTPEEPCCDLAYARVDGDFFMRIERIDPDRDLAGLRDDMALALSAVGEPGELGADRADVPAPVEVELAGRARGDGVTLTMLVARIGGGRYRATFHLPHREPAEGIGPSLWAMLASLRTTGPRPAR